MLKRAVQGALKQWGYRIVREQDNETAWNTGDSEIRDFEDVYALCRPYTMTSKERMFALFSAVRHVVSAKIPGDIVECGVWRGGSSMLAAETLARTAERDRRVCLFDTFEGMPEPTTEDVDMLGRTAQVALHVTGKSDFREMCYASLEDVTANMYRTNYPHGQITFTKGKVEDTIPQGAPERIAILRLDTDWYASTYHELVHLYPRLSPGGVLIIDDYGYWKGAREAVQKYFSETKQHILLNRIDHTGRIGVKTAS